MKTKILVVIHSISTSNHNLVCVVGVFAAVVIHSISTSNHNLCLVLHLVNIVVIHSISTSNHNLSCFNALFCGGYMAFELYKILAANTKEVAFDEFSARY